MANPIDITSVALNAPSDISLLGLFLEAHLVVKAVMIGLVIASIWTWAIIVDKALLYGRTKRQLDRFESVFWSGQSLDELYRSLSTRTTHGMAALFVAAMFGNGRFGWPVCRPVWNGMGHYAKFPSDCRF